jgi:hypothetical protein
MLPDETFFTGSAVSILFLVETDRDVLVVMGVLVHAPAPFDMVTRHKTVVYSPIRPRKAVRVSGRLKATLLQILSGPSFRAPCVSSANVNSALNAIALFTDRAV